MKANINQADKLIRIGLAISLIIIYLKGIVSGIAGIVILALAIIFIATALINFCPIYHLLGISTKKKNNLNK